MFVLISPSKTMDFKQLTPASASSLINPTSISERLRKLLCSFSHEELVQIYKASDSVTQEGNTANHHPSLYTAIELMGGLVFKNLDFQSLVPSGKQWLNDHVYIFSAMYGLVPANAGIRPYRLDLNNSLSPHWPSLTETWIPYVNETLRTLSKSIIVDLASSEYRKLIDFKSLNAQYIRIDFKDYRNGSYKILGTFAKMARGQFLREMALHSVDSIVALQSIQVMDYRYDPGLSSDTHYIYSRIA